MIEAIDIFFSQFGGKKNIVYLIFFFVAFYLICSQIKQKTLRFSLAIFFGIFIVSQLISLYFTQSFVGYSFFIHCNTNGIQGMAGLFLPFIIFSFLLFLGIVFALSKSYRFSFPKINSTFKNLIVLTSLGIVLFASSFASDFETLIPVFSDNKSNFKEILHKNGMSDYVTPENIKSSTGKNIIVISLESIEKGFLHPKFANLTPNLQRLQEEWNLVELHQNKGSEWTSGSLYTLLTGFPAFFGIHGNSIFQATKNSQITSISHILKKANYNTTFLNGNTNFAGTKSMLYALDMDKIIDNRSTKPNGNESIYGIRDKDLFELAEIEIEEKIKSNKPFAVFISTTDTHFPDGIYDQRMEKFIAPKNSDLEFMVSSVDYMVGKFINFLTEKNLLENTAIYIFPDHLKMGNPAIFDGTGERDLYLISNVDPKNFQLDSIQKTYQVDLPNIILNGANVTHNTKFLTDFIPEDKNEFIEKNILPITEINTNGLQRNNAESLNLGKVSPNYEAYKKDTMRYIAHADGKINGYTYTNSKEALDLSYKKGFRLFELDIIETKDEKLVGAHDWKRWQKITGFKGEVPPTLEEFMQCKIHRKFSPLDMNGINDWFAEHKDAILVTDKINDPVRVLNEFKFPERLLMELFSQEAIHTASLHHLETIMLSQNLIEDYTKKDVEVLAKTGIKNVAISRDFIAKNKELLAHFKENGIKVYAFHINFNEGYNEDYVTKYELDFIYGMYSDEWEF